MKNRKKERKKKKKEEIRQCLIELRRYCEENHRPDIVEKIDKIVNKH